MIKLVEESGTDLSYGLISVFHTIVLQVISKNHRSGDQTVEVIEKPYGDTHPLREGFLIMLFLIEVSGQFLFTASSGF